MQVFNFLLGEVRELLVILQLVFSERARCIAHYGLRDGGGGSKEMSIWGQGDVNVGLRRCQCGVKEMSMWGQGDVKLCSK